ncbi:hypothetical protein ACHAPT_007268 [Fusarium lateritium]
MFEEDLQTQLIWRVEDEEDESDDEDYNFESDHDEDQEKPKKEGSRARRSENPIKAPSWSWASSMAKVQFCKDWGSTGPAWTTESDVDCGHVVFKGDAVVVPQGKMMRLKPSDWEDVPRYRTTTYEWNGDDDDDGDDDEDGDDEDDDDDENGDEGGGDDEDDDEPDGKGNSDHVNRDISEKDSGVGDHTHDHGNPDRDDDASDLPADKDSNHGSGFQDDQEQEGDRSSDIGSDDSVDYLDSSSSIKFDEDAVPDLDMGPLFALLLAEKHMTWPDDEEIVEQYFVVLQPCPGGQAHTYTRVWAGMFSNDWRRSRALRFKNGKVRKTYTV